MLEYGFLKVDFSCCFSRILATPTEETWPGVADLPDYKQSFPMWKGNSLTSSCKQLDPVGLDLLTVIF
jgi:hypothetical protein